MAQLTGWTLDMPTDKIDDTCMGDGNKTYVPSWKDLKGTIKFIWNDASDDLYSAADSTDGVKIYLYPASTAITKYFYGPAWLDVSLAGDVNGLVDGQANFAANGTWGRK
jgi:hypothetical protein